MEDLLQQASREMRTMKAVCLRVMTDTDRVRDGLLSSVCNISSLKL